MGYVARTDTLELYVHECRQVLWTVSNRERVARRAACHLSVAGAQVLGQVKVVGAVGVVVLTVLLTVRVVPAPAPIRIEPELDAILVQPVRAAAEGLAEPVEDVATRSARGRHVEGEPVGAEEDPPVAQRERRQHLEADWVARRVKNT